MKLSEIIGLVVVFLGLAGAFQGFFAVDFFSKLVALAAGGSIVLWVVARRLTDWVRIKPTLGFAGHRLGPPLKLGSAVAALGLICLAFAVVAWFVIWLYAINIEENYSGDRVVFWIRGSRQAVEKLTVSYPRRSESQCKPETDDHPAIMIMRETDGPNPWLELKDFSYPQSQGLSCLKGTKARDLSIVPQPPAVEILRPDRRLAYERYIFVFGGVLWIGSALYFALRSQLRWP